MDMPKTKLVIKVKKLDPEAKLPTHAYKGDAGYDLYALTDVSIPYGSTREIPVGIAIEPPAGYFIMIATRSCHGRAGLAVHSGIIDPGYRGPISVHMRNVSTDSMVRDTVNIKKGDKVAQFVLLQCEEEVVVEEAKELSKSERGEKGYGSSGR